MNRRRFDRILASTAMAVVLTASGSLLAMPESEPASDAIEATLSAPAPAAAAADSPAVIETADPTTTAAVPSAAPSAPADPAEAAPTEARAPAAEPQEAPAPSVTVATPAPAAPPTLSDAEVQAAVPVPAAADVPPPAVNDVVKNPVADIPSADQVVALKLREIAGSRLDRTISRKADRSVVEAFYSERGFAPLWIENGAIAPRAKAAVAVMKNAEAVGLNPDDYLTPNLDVVGTEPQGLAEAEIKLTVAVLMYARHAQAGRINPARISQNIEYPVPVPEIKAVLTTIAASKDVGATMDEFNPQNAMFKGLRAKLTDLRAGRNDAPARIAHGQVIKLKMKDPRVPQIRERLGAEGDAADTTFDPKLSQAVKGFQRNHKIPVTGTVTPATIDALNGPPRGREVDTILVNMERLRWLPRELGKAHVVVNIPEYALRVFNGGTQVWKTRIVTGKPDKATPLLTASMKYITVNPTWNVPPSIVQNEYLPALAQDSTVLARMGLKVSYNRDGSIHISQPPGDRNALGRIRFNFPNRFLVYQHDTPDKHLFAHDKRAYSHGCMRVQDPFKYGEVILSIARPKEGYTEARLRSMIGSAERDITLPQHIQVHLTYQTAFVDETGKLQLREDVYGYDSRMLPVLKGESRVADFAPIAAPRMVEGRPAGTGRRVAGGGNRRGQQREARQQHGWTIFDLFR